jgi:hypothetical protein
MVTSPWRVVAVCGAGLLAQLPAADATAGGATASRGDAAGVRGQYLSEDLGDVEGDLSVRVQEHAQQVTAGDDPGERAALADNWQPPDTVRVSIRTPRAVFSCAAGRSASVTTPATSLPITSTGRPLIRCSDVPPSDGSRRLLDPEVQRRVAQYRAPWRGSLTGKLLDGGVGNRNSRRLTHREPPEHRSPGPRSDRTS